MNDSSRTSNSLRNIVIGLCCQSATILLSFVSRTCFIYKLGDLYNGIGSFFGNIFAVLSLTELGVGTALTFALYKPIAENNIQKLSSLMLFYKKVYEFIALIIFLLGLLLLPFLPMLMRDLPPTEPVRLYYLLALCNTSISYLFVYKVALLNADQRNRVVTLINSGFTVLRNIFEILVLIFTQSYFIYLFVWLAGTILNNVTISGVANKFYPWLKTKVTIISSSERRGIFNDVKAVMYYKIASVLLYHTDGVLIAALVSVSTVGYYCNYTMLSGTVVTFLSIIFGALGGSIGNLYAKTEKEYTEKIFRLLIFVNFWIYSVCSICLFILLDDAIFFWLGQTRVLGKTISLAIALNVFLPGILNPIAMFRDATATFRKTKYIIFFTAILNIILSVSLGKIYGLAGIIFSTTLARLVTNYWFEPYILYKEVFKHGVASYFKKQISFMMLMLLSGVLAYLLCESFTRVSIMVFVIKTTICLLVPNLVFFLFYQHTYEFSELKVRIRMLMSGLLRGGAQ